MNSFFLLIDRCVSVLLYKYAFMYIYALTVPLGSLFSLIVPPESAPTGPTSSLVDFLFVQLGLVWYTVCFWIFFMFNRKIQRSRTVDVAPQVSILSPVARYFLLMGSWIVLLIWFFGPSLGERIGTWIGVEISAHFVFICTASMSLMLEIKQIIDSSTMANDVLTGTPYYSRVATTLDSPRLVKLWYVLVAAVLAIMVIWAVLVLETSLFYRSFGQKFYSLVWCYFLVYFAYFL